MAEDHPMRDLCSQWVEVIRKAQEVKEDLFGKTAKEIWQFFTSAHDFMYSRGGTGLDIEDDTIAPKFKMTLNKPAELVHLFGPVMYHKNPNRQVNAMRPDVPALAFTLMGGQQLPPGQMHPYQQQMMLQTEEDAARADLLEWFLNYLPNEFHLKRHSRLMLDEALLKGRGCMWHSAYSPEGSNIVLPRSAFDSVDNLLIDPDATSLENATWIARQRELPKHEFLRRHEGVIPDDIRGTRESYGTQAAVNDAAIDGPHARRSGITHDIVRYWEVYSKAGAGQHLKSHAGLQGDGPSGPLLEFLDSLGQYVYLVISDELDYPANFPPAFGQLEAQQGEDLVRNQLRWPIPFWADNGAGFGWPVSLMDFHPMPGCVWPMAHMKPALGELRFLNWAMSFMMGRIHSTSRHLMFYAEQLESEIVEGLRSGDDLAQIPMKMATNKSIKDLIHIHEFPQVNKDLLDVVGMAMELFDKRTGLTELMYGMGGQTQMRSASESQIRREQMSIRPDDMAEVHEECQSLISRREAQIARWFVRGESVAPIFGETFDLSNPDAPQVGPMSQLWEQLVAVPLDYDEPETITTVVREFSYRVESGSVRKPNRDRDISNMDQAINFLMPLYQSAYQMTGDPTQINWLLTQWAKTRDLDIEAGGLLQPPPPPQPPPEEGGETIPMEEGAA